jgi:hypothetical protein
VQVKLASRSQKSESAAKPLANVSATRDGDIGPARATPRTRCSTTGTNLWLRDAGAPLCGR